MRNRYTWATAAALLLAAAPAFADFTAYNDGVWYNTAYFGTLHPNVTNVQEPQTGSGGPTVAFDETISGQMKNFVTGDTIGAKLTMTNNTGNPVMYETGDFGSMAFASGTDAYNTFNGIVDLNGFIRYGNSTGWWMDVEVSGLDPNMQYEFVTTANRNGSTYGTRFTRYIISGADSFLNASTAGTTIETIAVANDATNFCAGLNTTTGYVARWTGIRPGSDGKFTVRAQAGSTENKSYMFQAIKLVETPVPEPASIGLLGFGAMALLARRRRA